MGGDPATLSPTSSAAAIEIGLSAAIVSVHEREPQILVVRSSRAASADADSLPFGPFSPQTHRTLEIGLRAWVRQQSGVSLGYAEQLYTFGDRGRHLEPGEKRAHVMSVGYLALSRSLPDAKLAGASWSPWYAYFPWEDWRQGKPEILGEIESWLKKWAKRPPPADEPLRPLRRTDRLRVCFGIGGGWDEEKLLERYELLYEAGLVVEARRDGRPAAEQWKTLPQLGRSMAFDHRRILATAISRLRGKLKYRPVIFELLPPQFTLFELQLTVEAISGGHLHKQNFRRLVENARLVEPTGKLTTATGGRPAKLYRFRKEVVVERASAGLRVKTGRIGLAETRVR